MTTADPISVPNLTPIQRFGEAIADRVQRWMPSPFLFAILLTYVAAGAAFVSEGSAVTEIALSWYGGFWDLLEFAMQMVIILVTANVVAYHPWVKRVILSLVRFPKNGPQAVVLVGVGSMLTAWVSWGLGLIFGAILAREMGEYAAKNEMPVHYPLLAVAGYMGISLIFGWGMSSSPGLLQAMEGNALMQLGFVDRVIPATEWVFHRYPLSLTALSLVYVSIMLYLLSPPKENCRAIGHYVDLGVDEDPRVENAGSTPPESDPDVAGGARREAAPIERAARSGDAKPAIADKIDNSRILGGILALTGVVVVLSVFFREGLVALNLDNFNFGLVMIGLLLYASPTKYLQEFYDAVKGSSGVILLFPFYAGIIGIMTGTGLVDSMTTVLLSVANADTFPVVAWITGGILNVFVPSAGGEWTIIGGPMMMAGAELGIPHGQTIAAYAAGDAHTNLLNPFWAIPLLAITGLRARDMFGYAITMMLLLIPFLAIVLYLLPY